MRDRHSSTFPNSAQRVLDATSQVKVAYVETAELSRWLATSGTFPLGVVSFGAPLPVSLPCPSVRLELPLLESASRCEVWSSDQPVRFHADHDMSIAMSGDLLFGSITAGEEAEGGLDHTTELAYRRLLRLLRESGFPYLWRIWNYFPRINEPQHGVERYRLFCIGRHQALADALPGFPGSLPAGTAVGTQGGPLQIYFLAGTHSGTHLANPRQVNAYDYPTVYGPRSPSFARATLCRSDNATQLFISGTASVVGHASQHLGSAELQVVETVANLRALIDRAQQADASLDYEAKLQFQSMFKVYVRNARDLDRIRAVLQSPFFMSSHLLYLQGDLCRRELLVEIEGLINND